MNVIAVVSQKGGAGKTSFCAHLAVEVQRQKKSVAWIDMDPQGSLTSFYREREAETPLLLQSDAKSLKEHLRLCEQDGIEFVFIDTPPSTSKAVTEAVKRCHFALVPVRAGVLDILAIEQTVDLLESLGKDALLILNQVNTSARDAKDARVALSGFEIPIAELEVPLRVQFSRPMITGQVINELHTKRKESQIIQNLWKEISHTMEMQ